jgi:hypothetical protein
MQDYNRRGREHVTGMPVTDFRSKKTYTPRDRRNQKRAFKERFVYVYKPTRCTKFL